MPGFEVFGAEELSSITELFEKNGGILFAHGFDRLRKGIYRVREFEVAFSHHMGVQRAQAVSSGSAALKVSLQALGIQPGDEVITQAHTFIATVEAIITAGAKPVIVNINKTFNMDPREIEGSITKQTRAILPVHMMGAAAQMDEIMDVARKHNLPVIEDTAQALGGTYRGKYLGTIGTLGAFSFDFGKTITTGEGGMVLTNHEALYIRARAAHDHGHAYSKTIGRGKEDALTIGFNYRMTELQAAIGLVQLGKLNTIIMQQRNNKKKLKSLLKDLPLEFRQFADKEGDSGDTLVFLLKNREQAVRFAAKLAGEQVDTKNLPDALRWHFAQHWGHIFKEHSDYRDTYETRWQRSAELLERSIAIPIMVKMTDEQIQKTAEKIIRITKEII